MHIYYKNTHSKQYHKAAKRRAGLRTETTVNNTYDFGIGRRLCNLPALRQIGFEANRRILEVKTKSRLWHWGNKVSCNCSNRLTSRAGVPRPCVLATHGSRRFLPCC